MIIKCWYESQIWHGNNESLIDLDHRDINKEKCKKQNCSQSFDICDIVDLISLGMSTGNECMFACLRWLW